MTVVVGWDIGGAHLKAARAVNGRIVDALQVPSPLRLGLDAVVRAFRQAQPRMRGADRHVFTMTGELADTFDCRAEGVACLAEAAVRQVKPERAWIYGGRAGFIAPAKAPSHVEDIASANWHATASLIAKRERTALVIDMGSTTTDVVPVVDGRVAARGYTDAERLVMGELVYTGLVRTPLMAVADRAPVMGEWTPLIRENFATMADVHRILVTLPEGADQMDTADGRSKTPEASRARLARMVGRDADAPIEWEGLARWFAERQLRTIVEAAALVVSRGDLGPDAPVVAAGIGAELISEIARRLNRSMIRFETLLNAETRIARWASYCAPAAALAVLDA